jgi:hypothetical protein
MSMILISRFSVLRDNIGLPGPLAPAPHRIMEDHNSRSARISSTSRMLRHEGIVQSDGTTDDLGGKAMTIARIRWRLHAASLVSLRPTRRAITVTMPRSIPEG